MCCSAHTAQLPFLRSSEMPVFSASLFRAGVPMTAIAEAHFGWLAMFMDQNLSASSAITREKLNCKPTGPGLITDLDGMNYAQA